MRIPRKLKKKIKKEGLWKNHLILNDKRFRKYMQSVINLLVGNFEKRFPLTE